MPRHEPTSGQSGAPDAGSPITGQTLLQLLTHLRDAGLITLSPRDILRVETALQARERWTPASCATALASLFATGPDPWQEIHARSSQILGAALAAHEATVAARNADDTETTTATSPEPRSRPSQPRVSEPGRSRRLQRSPRPRPDRRRIARRPWPLALAVVALVAAIVWLIPPEPQRLEHPPAPSPLTDSVPRQAIGPIPPSPKQTAIRIEPKRDRIEIKKTMVWSSTPQFIDLRSFAPSSLPPEPPVADPAIASPIGWLAAAVLAVVTFLAIGLGLRGLWLPRIHRQGQRELRRRVQADRRRLRGDVITDGTPYHVERKPPLPRSAIEDAATVLGSIHRLAPGADLDIPATLDATIRAGFQPVPIHASIRKAHTVLVFVDIESGDHPFLHAVDWLLAHWSRIGIDLIRYDYRHIPRKLVPRSGANSSRQTAIELADVARTRAGMPLILFSRLRHIGSALAGRPEGRSEQRTGQAARRAPDRAWPETLTPWPERVLVDLEPTHDIDRPHHEQRTLRACQAAGLLRFPFTSRGLVAAARALATGYAAPEPWPDLPSPDRPAVAEALRLWATAAACVPDPGWLQLESLRQRFAEIHDVLPAPAHVQRLVEWLAWRHEKDGFPAPEGARGDRLAMHLDVRARLIAEQDRNEPDIPADDRFTGRVRHFLMDQLRRARPRARDGLEARRIDIKLAYHQAMLDPAQRERLLADFAGSAMQQELAEMLREALAIQRLPGAAAWSPDELLAARGVVEPGSIAAGSLLGPAGKGEQPGHSTLPGTDAQGAARRPALRWLWPAAAAAGALVLVAASWTGSLRPYPRPDPIGAPAAVARPDIDVLPRVERVIDPQPEPGDQGKDPADPIAAAGDLQLATADAGVADPPAPPENSTTVPGVASTSSDTAVAPGMEDFEIDDGPAGTGNLQDMGLGQSIAEVELPSSATIATPLRPPMVRIPGGRFVMGSPSGETGRRGDEGPQHPVRVSAFEMCQTEVTEKNYQAVMGTIPINCEYDCDPDMPVHTVSWFDAVEYMNRLTETENRGVPAAQRKTLCYDKQGNTWTWKRRCTGYRLPTEAEWEYAARGGTTTRYYFGDDESQLANHAWYWDNAGGKVHRVGTTRKRAHPWGLHDMHGNVWEWVWDRYAPYRSPQTAVVNPRGLRAGDPTIEKVGGEPKRVLRGGGFAFGAGELRSATRLWGWPRDEYWVVGFRCVRDVPER